MARIAITLQRLHGETTFQVTSGPEVHLGEQMQAAKNLARSLKGREHPEIAELQVWTSSDGCRKRFKFHPPGQPAAPGDEDEEDDAPLTSLKVEELRALALKLELDVTGLKKNDLIAAIEAKQNAAPTA